MTDTLTSVGTLPEPGRFLSAVSDGDSVYILGTCMTTCETRGVTRYDVTTAAVLPMDVPMAVPVSAASAVWTTSGIYVFGGKGCDNECATIQRFLPNTSAQLIREDLHATASGFNVVDLAFDVGAASNSAVVSYQVWDALAGWVDLDKPGLVAFTPFAADVEIAFEDLGGTLHTHVLQVVVGADHLPVPLPPVLLEYGGQLYGNAVAWNPNNLDYLHEYSKLAKILQTIPLVNVTTPAGTEVGLGLADVGFQPALSTDDLRVCTRDLWTGQAAGLSENFDGLSRLAISTLDNITCGLHLGLPRIKAGLDLTLLTTIEVRQGSGPVATVETLLEPLRHAVTTTDPATPPSVTTTLASSLNAYAPTAYQAAVDTRHLRIVILVPDTLNGVQLAEVVRRIIRDFETDAAIIAVEIEHVPLTRSLSVSVSDTGSGIARVQIWLNDTKFATSTSLLDANYTSTATTGAVVNDTTPQLTGEYHLIVRATDEAGNVQKIELDWATVQSRPALALLSPEFLWQSINNGSLRIATDIAIPNFPGESVADAKVWVNTTTGTNVFTGDLALLGTGAVWWTPASAADGSYNLTVRARVGIYDNHTSVLVNVTHGFGATFNLTQYRTYGTMNGTGTTDLYRLTPGTCSGKVTLTLNSLDGSSVRFKTTSGDPAVVGRGGTYNQTGSWTTTSDVLEITSGFSATAAFSVLVEHAGSDSHYSLTYDRNCGGGGGGVPPPIPKPWYVN